MYTHLYIQRILNYVLIIANIRFFAGNDYVSHNRSGYRSYRGHSRHFHNNYENRSNNAHYQEGHVKNPLSSNSEERTVVATDKSIKVTLNQGKGPVMSVKGIIYIPRDFSF